MINGIDKKALFSLKAEPYLKPISDLGVGFYNLDENTAKIEFQLYNPNGTLQISENNVNAYAYFESANGSTSDVIDLKVLDGLNGIVGITLDKEFLQASTDTKVKGQVYIGVNNVDNKPEYNEVAVFREFTFEVADALINKISSFTKIEYIRMFDQLKARILQRVNDIEQAIANGADYVAEMKTVKQQAITQINQTVTEGKAYIDNVIAQAQTNINDTATSATRDVNTAKDNAISTMDAKVSESIGSVNNVSADAIEHVNAKMTEFNSAIEENGFVQPSELEKKLNDLNWQKYPLVQDDGTTKVISLSNDLETMHNLPPGNYYATTTPINVTGTTPSGASSTAGFLTVEMNGKSVKRITFRPYNSTQIWIKRFYNQWFDWERVDTTQTDTGWIPFQLINGALSNTAYTGADSNGFPCAYRTITDGNETKRLVRFNGTNLTQGQVIAQLPVGFVKNAQTFPIRVPTSNEWSGAYIVMRPNGEVRFYINGSSTNWNASGYLYGQFEWTD